MLTLTLISAFLVSTVAETNPEFEAYKLARPQEFSGEFQGDILVDETQTRNSVIGTKSWPNGIVPYDDSSMDHSARSTIREALDELQSRVGSCVKFIQRTNQYNYIKIKGDDDKGCSSSMGVKNRSPQDMQLAPGCVYTDIIQHEFIHALGFHHEQCRSDRDQYIQVNLENVKTDLTYNFIKDNTNNYGLPYDYGSIMQYGKYAFSKNGKATMIAKNGGSLGGSLSNRDVEMIQRRYGCEQCIGHKCTNGGICVPNSSGSYSCSSCKPGYTGNICQTWTGCDCDYRRGGCVISDPPARGHACYCVYKGAWTCRGQSTSCKHPTNAKCLNPDKSYATCLEGNGDCGGY